MPRPETLSRFLLGTAFVAAGVLHFVKDDLYAAIVPPYLPFPLALVYVSGVCEIGLGAAVLVRRFTRPAAWGLVALLVAVFPANVHMALHPGRFGDLPAWLLYARLPLQGVLIAWAWWHTREPRPA